MTEPATREQAGYSEQPRTTNVLYPSPLAAALAAVQAELPRLGKSETGRVSGVSASGAAYSYEYKYADLAAISAEVLPLLGRHGLAFTSWPGRVDGQLVLEYHLLHQDGERMTGYYPIAGNTSQALGSSISYARRYCLCAVVGVAPDKDDDAAAADGERERAREAQRSQKQAEESRAYTEAVNAVTAAWTAHVGEWDREAGRKAYAAWSKGGVLADADVEQLRGFQRWIMDQPLRTAGDVPAGEAPPAEDPADYLTGEEYRGSKNPDAPMSGRQRGQLFVLLGELGLTQQPDQLRWVNQQLKTEYASRRQITAGDADLLITALKAGDVPAQSERAE